MTDACLEPGPSTLPNIGRHSHAFAISPAGSRAARPHTPRNDARMNALPTWTPLHVPITNPNASELSVRSNSPDLAPRRTSHTGTAPKIRGRRGRPPGLSAARISGANSALLAGGEGSWAENLAAAMTQAYDSPLSASRPRTEILRISKQHKKRTGSQREATVGEESPEIDIISVDVGHKVALDELQRPNGVSSPEVPHPDLPQEPVSVDDWMEEDEDEPPTTMSLSPFSSPPPISPGRRSLARSSSVWLDKSRTAVDFPSQSRLYVGRRPAIRFPRSSESTRAIDKGKGKAVSRQVRAIHVTEDLL
jgi:hypothetical protein